MEWFTPAKRRAVMAVPIAVLLAVGIASFVAFARLRETRLWVAHTHEVIEATTRVVADLTQAETAERGYLLTGRNAYLQPYIAALRTLPADTAELRRLTLESPRQQARLDVLRPLIALKFGEMDQTIEMRRTRGAALALQLVESDRGRTLMEESQRLLTDIQREEGHLLQARMDTEAFRARMLLAVVLGGLLAAVATMILVNRLLARYAAAQDKALRHIAEQHEELTVQRDALEENAGELEMMNEELLERTRAAEEAQEAVAVEHQRVVSLHDLTVALSGAARFADVAAVVGRWGCDVLGADASLVTLMSADGTALEPLHATGAAEEVLERWPAIPLSAAAVIADAARRGEVVYAASAAVRQALYPDLGLDGMEAGLAAPLRSEGRLLGSWGVYFSTPRLFTADELQLFEGVTEQCAQALERARLFEAESDARQEAESANAAKVKFLRAMSHDLRTPLNAILGYSELLQGGYVGSLDTKQTDFITRILASTTVLRTLIEEVLEFARIEAGRVEIRPADVSVEPLLEQVATMVAPQAEAKGILLARKPAPPVLVRGDAGRIGQILSNLVTNAVKYTPFGGAVSVTADANSHSVEIRVADTGPGIQENDLERIFEPFVQLESDQIDATRHGVGLGLAISRELARAMGGDLNVASHPGEGATFTLRLPRSDARNEPRSHRSARTA